MVNRVLLVDDDPDWQLECQDLIGNICNVDITTVANYPRAYTALTGSLWDLLITNIVLGRENLPTTQNIGVGLARIALRQGVPTIVMSGRADDVVVRDLFKDHKIIDYFNKARFNHERFVSYIKKYLILDNILLADISNIQISLDDKKYIINHMSELAITAPIPAKDFFRNLIITLSLPSIWESHFADIWSGNSISDSNTLFRFLECRSLPSDHIKQGYTSLGLLIECLFEESFDGNLIEIICKNKLISNEEIIESLRSRSRSSN
jgi:hypothetical protein